MALRDAENHRRGLIDLTTLSIRDLIALWRTLDHSKADDVRDALLDVLPLLINQYGSAAGALGADFYDEMRDASGAAGSFTAVPADASAKDRVEALVRWGIGPLYGGDGADAALSMLTSGLQRLVADVDRATVQQSTALDPAEPMFARHASANACAFCALLASRGAVYMDARAANSVTGRSFGAQDYRKLAEIGDNARNRDLIFAGTRADVRERGGRAIRKGTTRNVGEKYHDKCHCIAVPVWDPAQYEEAPHVKRFREAYLSSAVETKAGRVDATATLAEMRKTLGTS